MTTVSEAVNNRQSIRAFTKKQVSNEILESLIYKSSRSPSGGNLQPWRIFIINGNSMKRFLEFQDKWKGTDTPEYPIYPAKLKSLIEPHGLKLVNSYMVLLELKDQIRKLG